MASAFERLARMTTLERPLRSLIDSVAPAAPPPAGPAAAVRAGYVAPRTLVEHQLAQIWESLFAAGPVGMADDFFSLGGHSMLAVQMAARVRSALGRELPLQALLSHPTIEALAAFIEAGSHERVTVVPLAQGPGLPIVCPHPLGGHVLSYGPLGRTLNGAHRMIGLQAPGLNAGESPAPSWDALVSRHWDLLDDLHRIPFALVGYSYGAYIAMELATRAYAAGAACVPVVLLDAPHPSVIPSETRTPDPATLLHAMFGHSVGLALEEMQGRSEADLVQLVYDAALARRVLPPATPIDQVERLLSVASAHSQLPPPVRRYDFPISLLRAREGATRVADIEDYGWRPYCERVHVEWVDGSHETMLEAAHVEGIATFLRKYLVGTAVSLPRS
jgi:thioesterase domain-containing protein